MNIKNTSKVLKTLILTGALLTALISCGDKESKASTTSQTATKQNVELADRNVVDMQLMGNKAAYDSVTAFFKPDYTAELPDQKTSSAEKKARKAADSSDTTSFIPGIRKLSEYLTAYSTKRKSQASYTASEPEVIPEDNNPEVAFEVKDWGPRASIASENEFPTFYVLFTKPVRALQALDKQSSTSEILSIEPALKGTFHWYGTKHISFEAEEAADPSQVYKITVKNDLTNIYGETITGNTVFNTTADPIEINNLWGGYIKNELCSYGYDSGAKPPYENRFFIRTNYKLTEKRVSEELEVSINKKPVDFTVKGDFTDENFNWWGNYASFDADKGTTNSFVITITSEVPHNASVNVKFQNSKNSSSYKTLQNFVVTEAEDVTHYTDGKKGNPFSIYFNQTPDENTVIDNIIFKGFTITKENFQVIGNSITFFNLPVELNTSYSYTIKRGLKDIYGQNIYSGIGNYTFTTREPKSYVRYLNSGAKMLEAQYPHKLIYEYQNALPGSYYQVGHVENPVEYDYQRTYPEVMNYLDENAAPNMRHFEEIDLDPFLKNGYGFVRFNALTKIKEYNYWNGKTTIEDYKNVLNVQVTDLGITTRLGLNKAVVLVRSLSTGKPVTNAEVHILHDISDVYENPMKYVIASGKTDAKGFCTITYTEEQMLEYERSIKYGYDDYLSVYVINGDDQAVFTPTSHNMWRSNVTTGYRFKARDAVQRTFMFVDRGLYRPGETVTFRGIDRDQILGELKAHKGQYEISVKGTWWRAPEIMSNIKGTASESGGFWGSFKLPDDLDPGTYNIIFKREGHYDDNDYDCQKITFTVAEFERLKIESSISVPDVTYFGGDSLSAELTADYLAGGALGGADYSVRWYRESTEFNPKNKLVQDYSYGHNYDGREYFSEDTGKLSADGAATLSANSLRITKGVPYTYHVEATVTDVSNQSISTSANITVHPAKFYVGVKRPQNISGFAKKDQKLEFPYILVDTEGNLLSDVTDGLKRVSSLEYTLTRDEWTLVHEQSVDNTIYSRYECKTVEEAKGTVDIKAKNNLLITPKEPGYHKLKIEGKDSEGNYIETDYSFYVTGGNSCYYNPYNSDEIVLTPNQSEYNPGDKAQILMESPLPSGDYLITVEREGIFTEEVRHFDSSADVIEIPVASNYVPVVYVSISSYSTRTGAPTHNYGEPDLDKPKGYYGVTALRVNPYVRAFSIDIETSKPTYKPGEDAKITLTATKNGKPVSGAELTVMAVDRGVLDLINYHVPNPIDYFYNPENFRLCVTGGDSRALLMDPVTYSIKDLQGGDADEDEKEEERKDFRPTAIFEPVVITDENGRAEVTFKMPDSLTTYRITAFGVKNDVFALQEDEVTVQNPVNIQQVQPRKLRERDTAECGVVITNLDAITHDITVSLEVRTPSGNTVQDEQEGRITVPGAAFVDGANSHTVKVGSGSSTVVYFDVGAKTQGTVELVYTINSDIINEKLISPLKIEKTYVYETVTMIGTINDDDKKASATELIAIPGFAKDGKGEVSFTLDATRLGLLGTSVNYLFDYPYGCLEQQSSRVLPLVLFGDYIDVFGLDSKVSDVKKVVKSYTKQWGKYQHANGGMPYWPDSNYESLYVSLRIAHIYAAALQHGYTEKDFNVNITTLKSYIRRELNNSYSSDYLKAYACYIFSLLNDNSMQSTLNSLFSSMEKLNLSTCAYVGLSYANLGMAKAEEVAEHIRKYLKPDERTVTVLRKNRTDFWDWYNTDTEQLALILQLLVSVDENDEMVDRALYSLLREQSRGYWKSTATTARVLEAIYTYIQERNLDDTNYKASVTLNGKKVMEESFKGAGAKPKTIKLPFEDEIIASLKKDTAEPVTFDKNGKGNLYYTVEMKYALPDEMQAARNEGIKLEYTIIEADTGRIVNPSDSDNSMITLKSGKTYKASIKVESNEIRNYLALRAPIPSGAEILDSTFVTTASLDKDGEDTSAYHWYDWYHSISNKVIHDNEIQFFWDYFRSGSTTVNFTFRASRRGVYPLPPVQAECMYEPETFGRGDGYLAVIE